MTGKTNWKVPRLSHLLEALLAYTAYGVFACMPMDMASAAGGWIGRTIASRMGISRRAYRHLLLAMPELSSAERKQIVRQMWDNMGRNIAETPHIKRFIKRDRLRIEGFEHVEDALKKGKGVLVAGGHFANWEVGPVIFWHHNRPMTTVYRRPNNPLIDPLLRHTRRVVTPDLLPKSHAAVGIMKTLRQNGVVGLLVDQKMSTGGTLMRFFGRPAMTGLATANIAIKTGAPLLIATGVRNKGVDFTVMISPPLAVPPNLPQSEAALLMTQQINDVFEAHIRQNPGQWLWLHRRWDNRKKPWDKA